MNRNISSIGGWTFLAASIGITSLVIFGGPAPVLDGAVLRPVEGELSAPADSREPPMVATGPPALLGPAHLFTSPSGPSEDGLIFMPVYARHYSVESYLSSGPVEGTRLALFGRAGLPFPIAPVSLGDSSNDGVSLFTNGTVRKNDDPKPIPEPTSTILFGVGLYIVGRALKTQLS